MNGKEQAVSKKLEAVMNHFNALGKYIIVNILVLYLTCRGLKPFLFITMKSMMKCQMLVLLQILYLEFQNSPSDYPNQIGIKTILNWKYYLLIRISEERYHRI